MQRARAYQRIMSLPQSSRALCACVMRQFARIDESGRGAAGEWLSCDTCGQRRPRAGSIRYNQLVFCNDRATEYEVHRVRGMAGTAREFASLDGLPSHLYHRGDLSMPYTSESAPEYVRRQLLDKRLRQWVEVWNSAYARALQHGSNERVAEASAFAQAQ